MKLLFKKNVPEASRHIKKAVLFVPFWRMVGHVGNNRVDRFRRWLSEDGFEVIIVCAGTQATNFPRPWGQEITVIDSLGLHPEAAPGQALVASPRKPNKLRRALAYWLFNPDPGVVWAKAAARDKRVQQATQGADFILSSSPPESAHVGAWILSQNTGVPHIMDMRDGWLDEPLKPILHTSPLRRWQERRLESRIAQQAKTIQVTSNVWKELFDARYPQLAHKVVVLTNGYPIQIEKISERRNVLNKDLLLIHAGRFTGSRLSQDPEILLQPLLNDIALHKSSGVIRFYGELSEIEVSIIRGYQPKLNKLGWQIEFPGIAPRTQMLDILRHADGLLLLSASHAAIPSKMFEYLATGLPIGYVTNDQSATDTALKNINIAVNLRSDSLINTINSNNFYEFFPPAQYSESELKKIFMSGI